MTALYDTIGVDYSQLRKPDPRIAAHIQTALGDAKTVLNVGAGTGSYEPMDREVTALEPSIEMISQRPEGSAKAIVGVAENLPFEDSSFDAVMAVLTVHHWKDLAAGLLEMRRVAKRRVVILTFDPMCRSAWLLDYLPALADLDAEQMPQMDEYSRHLGQVEIAPVPIPHDCSDGFLYAYWRRPAAYLDPAVRRGSSSFWALAGLEEGIARLENDVASGAWERRYAHLIGAEEYDAGYRLVTVRL